MWTFRQLLPNWSHVFPRSKAVAATAGCSDSQSLPAWRALYVAALFETDHGRMVLRIAEAKKALITRARELFQTGGDHLQEQSAIEDALQSLHALERCAMYFCVQRRLSREVRESDLQVRPG